MTIVTILQIPIETLAGPVPNQIPNPNPVGRETLAGPVPNQMPNPNPVGRDVPIAPQLFTPVGRAP